LGSVSVPSKSNKIFMSDSDEKMQKLSAGYNTIL
jgi:hypothetical protein